MPRCRSKIIIYLNFILSLTVRISTVRTVQISTVRTRFVPDSLSFENSPHIFTSYQISGTPAPKRTKEISCFTCLNLLIQNRFFFFNIHLRVIIRSSIGNKIMENDSEDLKGEATQLNHIINKINK